MLSRRPLFLQIDSEAYCTFLLPRGRSYPGCVSYAPKALQSPKALTTRSLEPTKKLI